MGWTKDKRRRMRTQGSERAGHDVNAFAPMMPERERPPAGPSKAAMAAEAAALSAGVEVTMLPTVRRLHCRSCQHQGTVSHARGRAPALRCSKCGQRA